MLNWTMVENIDSNKVQHFYVTRAGENQKIENQLEGCVTSGT